MIEITFLGRIIATLASASALLWLLGVFFAAAYVLSTAATAMERLPKAPELHFEMGREARRKRLVFWASGLVFVVVFGALVAVVSLGSTTPTFFFALGLGLVSRSCMRVCLVLAMRASDTQEGRYLRRTSDSKASQKAALARLEADRVRSLSGADLQAEVADADASLERLRDALSNLRDTRAALGQKLAASSGNNAPSKLDPAVARLRDELGFRIDIGQRVLYAAESAAFRLACAVPLKKLVRRRPVEVVSLNPRGAGNLGGRVDSAIEAIDKYIESIREARVELDEIAQRRPTLPPPGVDEIAEAQQEGAQRDPLERASREIDAIEKAYRALRDRLELFRLGLAAKAGLAAVASAASQVGAKAEQNGLSEQELGQLLRDLAAAERATSIPMPVDDEDLRALAEVLARGTSALDSDDRASLGEVVTALGEMG